MPGNQPSPTAWSIASDAARFGSKRRVTGASPVRFDPGLIAWRAIVCFAGTVLMARLAGANLLTQNGGFDSGAAGWHLSGGAEVVATGDPDDDPFARVPDGGVVFLYQKVTAPAPSFSVSFDFFTGLMNPAFPSPGGFPDTAFGTVYYGASEAGLAPEQFQSDGAFELLSYDATNGLRGTPSSATVSASSTRPGWRRFEGTFAGVSGQPFLALTFQNLDGNGVRGDSALLVDNVFLLAVPAPIPEPASGLTAAVGCSLVAAWGFRHRRRALMWAQ